MELTTLLTCQWIHTWLTQRSQQVVLDGAYSEFLRGLYLALWCFFLYINDITKHIESPLILLMIAYCTERFLILILQNFSSKLVEDQKKRSQPAFINIFKHSKFNLASSYTPNLTVNLYDPEDYYLDSTNLPVAKPRVSGDRKGFACFSIISASGLYPGL